VEILRRKPGLRSKAPDLPQRVNSRIGAASPMQHYFFFRQPFQHVDDFALYRRLPRLDLPPVEISAVVSDS